MRKVPEAIIENFQNRMSVDHLFEKRRMAPNRWEVFCRQTNNVELIEREFIRVQMIQHGNLL